MGKPRSIFNRNANLDREVSKQFGQDRQNATGMSSTFRSMPLLPPEVSSGQNTKIGVDTEKTSTLYLTSLRLDSQNRIDFGSITGITYGTSSSGSEVHRFDIGGSTVLQVQSSVIDCRQDLVNTTSLKSVGTTLYPFLDVNTKELSLKAVTAPSSPNNGELWHNTSDNKVYVRSGGVTSEVGGTAGLTNPLTTDLDLNGNELILDPDGDSIISSISDDNIQISTGGSVRASISNTGLLMATPITMLSSDIDLDGNELTIDADGDSYIQAVSDDTIQVVTSGTLRLQVDNSLVFANQDVGVITGKSVKGFFGVIGLQVSSSTLTVGSAGSLQVPYLSSTTTYSTGVNSTLDGIFGNLDGCMGIQYNSTSPTYTVWYRLNGGWRRNFLT
jgi:hypothetical protein